MNEPRLAELAERYDINAYRKPTPRYVEEIAWLLSLVRDLEHERLAFELAVRCEEDLREVAVRERDAARDAAFSHQEIGALIDAVAATVDREHQENAPLLRRLQAQYAAALSVPAVPPKEL